MVARKGKKAAVPDIRSAKDIAKLLKILAERPITLVLVYADWCGHCHTYKADTWKTLSEIPNRTVGMAQVNGDILEQSPLKNAAISGYPSVLVVDKDGKMAEFKENGEPTNAVPNARDTEAMTALVTAPESMMNDAVKKATGASLTSLDFPPTNEDPTPPLTKSAEKNRQNSASLMLNTLSGTEAAGTAAPVPDVEEDLIQSQNMLVTPETGEAVETGASGSMAEMEGGSLYRALLEAGKIVAPAAALTMGAVWATKRARRGTRKGRGKRGNGSQKLRQRALRSLSAKLRRRR